MVPDLVGLRVPQVASAHSRAGRRAAHPAWCRTPNTARQRAADTKNTKGPRPKGRESTVQHDATQPGGPPHQRLARRLVATGVAAVISVALAAQAHATESPDTSSTGRLQTVFDGINIDKPSRPTIGVGNQGGGHVSGFSASSFVGVEPNVDADSMGDETQDPDGAGLGTDWVDDWFEDFGQPAQLDD
jgi:hypothetical protein